MEHDETDNKGPDNASASPKWIDEAFRESVERIYSLVLERPVPGNEEVDAELGRWVNIVSYVMDNSIDGTLKELSAKDLIARAHTAVCFLLKGSVGALGFAREVRHEILMDIYRAEPISRHIIRITNGSPSFTVVLGVIASVIMLLLFSLIMLPIWSHFDLHPVLYIEKSFYAQTQPPTSPPPPQLEAAALAAFLGAIASILIRLERFEAQRAIDPKLLFLNAFFRPFVGMLLGLFVIGVQGIGLFSIGSDGDPDNRKFSLFLMVVGFLAGFSERLAGDVVGTVEGSLGADKARSRGSGQ
jgi:hypothetical protein